jgi:nucleotide-binding universal stress UspA family protein
MEGQIMFKRLVWATDGSEAADLCLPLVKTLAAESGGEVLVVYCEELTLPRKGGGSFPVHANEDELQAKIEAQVGQLSRVEAPARLEKTRARVGGAAQAIAEAAENARADLIVVGTRGHTPIGGLLLGSVTQRLLHIARCPVLAVPTRNAGSET